MPENGGMKVNWKVKTFLEQHGRTPYALWKESGLSRTAVYDICNGKQDGLRFDAMSKIITALERMTGQRVELTDVLEIVRP